MKSHLKFAAMQRSFALLMFVMLAVSSALASVTGFSVEVHATSEFGTTYRVYATFDDPLDWVQSVYGLTGAEGDAPMSLLADPGFAIYQTSNNFGVNPFYGQEVNPLFLGMIPDLTYDSWVTIGAENSQGDTGIQGAGMADAITAFNSGVGFADCGGAWFVASLSGAAPDWAAGDDLRVLLAQITMADDDAGNMGTFNFQFNLQWKDGAGTAGNYLGEQLSSSDFILDTTGCMDETACNYTATALEDDGSCEFTSCAGCLDAGACNYDAAWLIEDNSQCEYASCEGCTNELACNFDPESTLDNGSCLVPNEASCEFCEGAEIGVADSDADGVCDADEVIGCQDETACNFDGLATDAGACDYADAACEICEGGASVLLDDDGDGICNADETDGCTDETACNFAVGATDDDGSCEFSSCAGCLDQAACNYDENLLIEENSSCDYTSCLGCTNDQACNYDSDATQDDGSCDLITCYGCMDAAACNYDATAAFSDASCTYPEAYYDCLGECLLDFDGDGVCNELEIEGCTDETACNYDSIATENAGCEYAPLLGDCDTPCLGDFDGDGYCDNLEVPGCMSSSATNYNAAATDDDGSCDWTDTLFVGLSYEIVGHSTVGEATTYRLYAEFNSNDLAVQACYGTDDANWALSSTASFYQNAMGGLVGSSINPAFFASIPEMEFDSWFALGAGPGNEPGPAHVGLTSFANDFEDNGGNMLVNTAVGASIYFTPGQSSFDAPVNGKVLLGQFTTEGVVTVKYNLQFRDSESLTHTVTDLNLVFPANAQGCTNELACNYDDSAEFSVNAGCLIPEGCDACSGETDGTGTLVDNDADDDGVCDADEVSGCTDAEACNYDADPTTDTDNALCVYAMGCEECSGETDGTGTAVDVDADDDGVCDADEVTGCTDSAACNYDADPTTDTDDALCVYATGCDVCSGETDGSGAVVDLDADDDGVCDADELTGCTDSAACNFDENPTTDTDNALCVYATGCDECSGESNGSGVVVDLDADDDGVCDADEVTGCTDSAACNYDADPTTDTENSTCIYPEGCDTCSGELDGTGTVVNNDADGDEICDADEVLGCTNAGAVNFDPLATDDDGNCIFGECDDPLACNYVEDSEIPLTSTCEYPDPFFDCEGNCTGDYDGDGICEGEEIWGCASNSATNFDPLATNDDGSCIWGNGLFEGLSYEVVTDHEEGPIAGSGYVTYRVYGQFSTADIDLVQLYGNANHPWLIQSTGEVYQDAVGGDFGGNIPLALISYFPSVEFDSWLTIGAEPGDYNALNQSGMYAYLPAWNSGGDFLANGAEASISVTPAQSNQGIPDENGQVLLAQITTNGVVNLQYNVLFHPEVGDPITFTDVELTFPTQVAGCTNPLANNYMANANSDDGTCQVEGCMSPEALNFDPTANMENGLCQFGGCLDDSADNYDPIANVDDGSCLYSGCMDSEADNYNEMANTGDQVSLCLYLGCMDSAAINFSAQANEDDGSCLYVGCYDPEADNYNAQANWGNQAVLCKYYGCTDPDAANFDPDANFNDGTCIYQGCTDSNADNYDPQANEDNGSCEYSGCTDPDADNFDEQANVDDDSCLYTGCYDESADNFDLFANTGDQEVLCEYYGCMDAFADNYDAGANAGDQEALCIYYGCTDEAADNYDAGANSEDGSCLYFGCTDSDADNYDASANEDDGSCIYYGCTNIEADNFDPQSNEDDGSCLYTGCMDEAADNYWSLANFGVQEDECQYFGCTNVDADNYDADANVDDGSCEVAGCLYLDAINYNVNATYDDQSCIFQTVGCMDPLAWNYMESATEENGTCLYGGCTYEIAQNYDATATVDDGSCEWLGCTDSSAVNFDAEALHDDGSCELVGCMDEAALDFDAEATFPGSCDYPDVCPGDINGDLSVDVQDLLEFFQYYGTFCD